MRSDLRLHFVIILIAFLAIARCDIALGHGLALTLQQYREDDPAAQVGDQVFTVGDLTTLVGMRSARFRPHTALTYGVEDLLMQARHAPIYREIASGAIAADRELSPEDDTWLEQEMLAFTRRLLYRREVTRKLQDPTMAMLRDLYDQVKDTRLRTPERFLIRRITIPVANESESLTAREKLEALREEFMAGTDIMRLLRSNGLDAPTRVYYPDQVPDITLADALRTIADEQALPIDASDTAVELTIRHLHIPPGSVPFESSIDVLYSMLMDREATRLASEFFTGYAEEPGLVHFVIENLQSRGELALDSDVIILVGGQPIRRHELRAALGWQLEIAASGDPEEFRQLALSSGIVQKLLLDDMTDRLRLSEDPEVIAYRANLLETLMTRLVIEDHAITRLVPASDADALAHWRRKEAALGRFHGRVRFDHVTISASAPDIDEWVSRFSAVRSANDFNQVARDAMTRRAASLMMNGLQDHLDALPEAARDAVEEGRLPVLVMDDRADGKPLDVYWIVEGIPDQRPSPAEMEQARAEVNHERHQDAIEEILDDRSAHIEVEVLMRTAY